MEPQERRSDAESLDELLCNRTGIMNNPELSAESIHAAKKTVPTSQGDGDEIALSRADYMNEALPIGSPPLSCIGVSEIEHTGEQALAMDSEAMVVLLDKLGERLAFERQGTRLYEAFLQKFETLAEDDEIGPTAEEIQHIREQELEHFKLLQMAIVELGGDATVQSPSADIIGILFQGALQVVSDPRTTIPQSLQAILAAELADNDGWELLQRIAAEVGEKDLEQQCATAFAEEQEHLKKVRGWLLAMTIEEVSGVVETAEIDDEVEQIREERPRRKTRAKRSASPPHKKSKRKKK